MNTSTSSNLSRPEHVHTFQAHVPPRSSPRGIGVMDTVFFIAMAASMVACVATASIIPVVCMGILAAIAYLVIEPAIARRRRASVAIGGGYIVWMKFRDEERGLLMESTSMSVKLVHLADPRGSIVGEYGDIVTNNDTIWQMQREGKSTQGWVQIRGER